MSTGIPLSIRRSSVNLTTVEEETECFVSKDSVETPETKKSKLFDNL